MDGFSSENERIVCCYCGRQICCQERRFRPECASALLGGLTAYTNSNRVCFDCTKYYTILISPYSMQLLQWHLLLITVTLETPNFLLRTKQESQTLKEGMKSSCPTDFVQQLSSRGSWSDSTRCQSKCCTDWSAAVLRGR
jgi:hypothetical protein